MPRYCNLQGIKSSFRWCIVPDCALHSQLLCTTPDWLLEQRRNPTTRSILPIERKKEKEFQEARTQKDHRKTTVLLHLQLAELVGLSFDDGERKWLLLHAAVLAQSVVTWAAAAAVEQAFPLQAKSVLAVARVATAARASRRLQTKSLSRDLLFGLDWFRSSDFSWGGTILPVWRNRW